jgi:hypothetical protein
VDGSLSIAMITIYLALSRTLSKMIYGSLVILSYIQLTLIVSLLLSIALPRPKPVRPPMIPPIITPAPIPTGPPIIPISAPRAAPPAAPPNYAPADTNSLTVSAHFSLSLSSSFVNV